MKQKIVIRVQINCDKCRRKAMQVVASAGVESVAVEGDNRDQFVLVGDGVDPACLTKALRKKVGRADLIKVEEVKKEEKPKPKPADPPKVEWQYYTSYPPCPQVVYYSNDPFNWFSW